MSRTGKLLSTTAVPEAANEERKQETRVLKFGELQVELTPEKAYIGAVIGFIFAILLWQVSRGIESIPESSLEYANDNALLLAKCFSGGRSGGSRWDWEKSRKPNRRSRFSDTYVTDDYDEEVEFGSRNAAKKRMWWSDDCYPEDDWEEDEGFGILEASIGFNWVFKVFRAFGWMIPAVIISLLVGTGPDSIVMALALPLAQTAFSLAIEALWGRPDKKPRPKSKSKKRPFAGAPRRTRMRKEKDVRNQTGRGTMNYKSWVDATDVSSKQKRNPHFGGWDELDSEEPRETPVEKGNEPRTQERIKISRRTKGDTPLLMRFLIAMFPYLGFWIKLF